jgi:hypothetical protein
MNCTLPIVFVVPHLVSDGGKRSNTSTVIYPSLFSQLCYGFFSAILVFVLLVPIIEVSMVDSQVE